MPIIRSPAAIDILSERRLRLDGDGHRIYQGDRCLPRALLADRRYPTQRPSSAPAAHVKAEHCPVLGARRATAWAVPVLAGVVVAVLTTLCGATSASALVSIAEGDNSTAIAYEGSSNSLIFLWQSYGSQAWQPELVAPSQSTLSSPAEALGNGATNIAAEGPIHSLDFYSQDYGSSGWNPELVQPDDAAFSAPAILEADNANVVAVEGPENSLDFYWQSYGSAVWSETTIGPPGSAYSAPCIGAYAGHVGVFVEGPDHTLYGRYTLYDHKQFNGPWATQQAEGTGTTYSAPACGYDAFEGPGHDLNIVAAFEGRGNDLQVWAVSDLRAVTETVAGPGTTFSAPAVALGNSSISIAALGSHKSLDFYWQAVAPGQAPNASGWHQEQVAGTGSTFSVPTMAEGNNSTTIAAEGPHHSLSFYWQPYGGTTWNYETAASNGSLY